MRGGRIAGKALPRGTAPRFLLRAAPGATAHILCKSLRLTVPVCLFLRADHLAVNVGSACVRDKPANQSVRLSTGMELCKLLPKICNVSFVWKCYL
jgi:hypothetical protein